MLRNRRFVAFFGAYHSQKMNGESQVWETANQESVCIPGEWQRGAGATSVGDRNDQFLRGGFRNGFVKTNPTSNASATGYQRVD